MVYGYNPAGIVWSITEDLHRSILDCLAGGKGRFVEVEKDATLICLAVPYFGLCLGLSYISAQLHRWLHPEMKPSP